MDSAEGALVVARSLARCRYPWESQAHTRGGSLQGRVAAGPFYGGRHPNECWDRFARHPPPRGQTPGRARQPAPIPASAVRRKLSRRRRAAGRFPFPCRYCSKPVHPSELIFSYSRTMRATTNIILSICFIASASAAFGRDGAGQDIKTAGGAAKTA